MDVQRIWDHRIRRFAQRRHLGHVYQSLRDLKRLSQESESPNDPVYVCEFPTLCSIFRFVQIACDTFHCDHIECRTCPLNAQSSDWFS